MARRSEHSKEEIRRMAVNAAERLVVEQGPGGLSARKIAAEIGYTVGTLYLVFRNLDELILHVNARTLDELALAMQEVQYGGLEPDTAVLALGQVYFDYALQHTPRWSLIFEHSLPAGEPIPEWFEARVARNFQLVEQALLPLLTTRSAGQVAHAARALWGGVHGICILAVTGKLDIAGVESAAQVLESLIVNFLYGLVEHDTLSIKG